MVGIKWWVFVEAANEGDGGDGKRAVAQQYSWWPSNMQPRT